MNNPSRKLHTDPLLALFEDHLNNVVIESESSEDFLEYVVQEYLQQLKLKQFISLPHYKQIEQDLREEVLEMLRKRIYGYYSIDEYRSKARERGEASVPAPELRKVRQH
jgi:hypothetical protein